MQVIGLCGKMHHGKSTVANYIKKIHGYKEYSFASPLKEACRHMFQLSDAQLYGEAKDKIDTFWGVTPRYILQQVGTDLIRDKLHEALKELNMFKGIDVSKEEERPKLWVTLFQRFVQSTSSNIVVSDVRFEDEVAAVRAVGGVIWYVDRPDYEYKNNEITTHKSENHVEVFKPDVIISNDGDIYDLYVKVQALLCQDHHITDI